MSDSSTPRAKSVPEETDEVREARQMAILYLGKYAGTLSKAGFDWDSPEFQAQLAAAKLLGVTAVFGMKI